MNNYYVVNNTIIFFIIYLSLFEKRREKLSNKIMLYLIGVDRAGSVLSEDWVVSGTRVKGRVRTCGRRVLLAVSFSKVFGSL